MVVAQQTRQTAQIEYRWQQYKAKISSTTAAHPSQRRAGTRESSHLPRGASENEGEADPACKIHRAGSTEEIDETERPRKRKAGL